VGNLKIAKLSSHVRPARRFLNAARFMARPIESLPCSLAPSLSAT
jgi:hypothetical protein